MAYETYRTLVEGIQKAVYPGRQYRLWDFLELTERLETYPGTGEEAFLQKLQGKFRRAYVTYNNAFYKGLKTRKQLQEMTEKADSSHRHALALKEKNLQQQEKIETLVGIRPRIISDLTAALNRNNIPASIDSKTGDIKLKSYVF
ncbi:MAG: hypothetical protein IIT72_01880, partial [Lachnospiraceae bacterium]|nr:hypothetical protein [Lachnospiraceae bacterium]